MESEHFKSTELRCHHCDREGVQRELLDVLEALRAKAGPLKVNSAYRCPKHPVEARKPKAGFHAQGLAADLVPLAMPLRAFYDVIRSEPRIKGIGVDHAAGYIHVDVRQAAAPVLWVYRNGRAVVVTDLFQEVAMADQMRFRVTPEQIEAARAKLAKAGFPMSGESGAIEKDGYRIEYTLAEGELILRVEAKPCIVPMWLVMSRIRSALAKEGIAKQT
ncbi:MAG: hypothetical protein IH602_10540 [Bryobacteraceae bacterium]|nr:hypothetical protein [Bryobacteraceae bacterium]